MSIAGTNLPLITQPEGRDKISVTEKVTSPYFSNGETILAAANIRSSFLSDSNETYFFGISHKDSLATEEFNVAFGSLNGLGAAHETNTKSETEAIYKKYSSLLLAPLEVTGGFHISNKGSTGVKSANQRDEEIYVMSARRSNMKDRINKGTWQINFSGSNSAKTAAPILHLKDDSVNETPTSTPVGDRYNIVSCSSAGVIAAESTARNFGFFYPDMGIMVFSQVELSASIPGASEDKNKTVAFDSASMQGFGGSITTNDTANRKTALRFINCLRPNQASLEFRDEEDQVSAQYFCRIYSGDCNFSNNPTFVSGSLNEIRQTTMVGNPSTFITSVQLYNGSGEMVAVGNLSTPLKKNFSSEATIKVKLTY
jgi:hypothetical protein